MDRRCSECGSARRMVGRPDDSDLCTVCVGEQVHPADKQAADARVVYRFTRMPGFYDTAPEPGPAQGGVLVDELHAARKRAREEWAK